MPHRTHHGRHYTHAEITLRQPMPPPGESLYEPVLSHAQAHGYSAVQMRLVVGGEEPELVADEIERTYSDFYDAVARARALGLGKDSSGDIAEALDVLGQLVEEATEHADAARPQSRFNPEQLRLGEP